MIYSYLCQGGYIFYFCVFVSRITQKWVIFVKFFCRTGMCDQQQLNDCILIVIPITKRIQEILKQIFPLQDMGVAEFYRT